MVKEIIHNAKSSLRAELEASYLHKDQYEIIIGNRLVTLIEDDMENISYIVSNKDVDLEKLILNRKEFNTSVKIKSQRSLDHVGIEPTIVHCLSKSNLYITTTYAPSRCLEFFLIEV